MCSKSTFKSEQKPGQKKNYHTVKRIEKIIHNNGNNFLGNELRPPDSREEKRKKINVGFEGNREVWSEVLRNVDGSLNDHKHLILPPSTPAGAFDGSCILKNIVVIF